VTSIERFTFKTGRIRPETKALCHDAQSLAFAGFAVQSCRNVDGKTNALGGTTMTSTMVQRIAQWALSFDIGMVNARTIQLIKHSVLDSLGCAILTVDEECVRGVLDYVRSAGGHGPASVIGGGTATIAHATLANGALIRAILRPRFISRAQLT